MSERIGGVAGIAEPSTSRSLLATASKASSPHRFTDRFLETEWRDVVDEWQLTTWESYRDVARLGRKTRLGEQQRAVLWSIFARVRSELAARKLVTVPGALAAVTRHLASGGVRQFDFVVIDEAQDVSISQLRFLAALIGDRPDGLFFAGDLGQRIFQTPYSWKSLGVDIRGRSQTLRLNYRTSHQIRRQADRLLSEELTDVDGNVEVRSGTVSAFSGPEPDVRVLKSIEQERAAIAGWLTACTSEGVAPDEIGVFVRSDNELERARAAVRAAGLRAVSLDSDPDGAAGSVSLSTMHLAKGLEFRAVVVMACDDEILPLQSRIEKVTDAADLADIYETERRLLYVACTRARDYLLVTGVEPGSEFLEDLRLS